MKKKKKLLWIIDPWKTLDHERDTTLRLIEEARILGAECWIAEHSSVSLKEGSVKVLAKKVIGIDLPRTENNFRFGPKQWVNASQYHHIFYRVDPPIDLSYLLPLQLLSHENKSIHSPPSALFRLNEKWGATELGHLFPRSLVSANSDLLLSFIGKHKKVVLKPLYQAQSKGVGVLDTLNTPAASIAAQVKFATEDGKMPIIVQVFLPGIKHGETRLWFSGGKLIASVRKMPKSGESIINMDRGGSLEPAKLKVNEVKAVKAISRFLKKKKILWAAVDLIDGKITDFNHTSPGLIVGMENLLGKNLAREALRPLLR